MPPMLTPMAIVYDFDGTLAPGNMQEHAFIPDIGMEAADFWDEVEQLTRKNQADGILMYMYVMLEKAHAKGVPVRQEDFRKRGERVRLFDGVGEWFGRISAYGSAKGVDIEHYLISSGNMEIIEGSPIAHEFTEIYASKFMFDENGVARWPALAINFTTKTQFLFRINKGAHDLSDDSRINQFVPKGDRPVPFENMVYIGDGETDVPCFRLVKDEGGLSIAVYQPDSISARDRAATFMADGRVQRAAPAIYTEGGELEATVKARIDLVAANRDYTRTLSGE